MRVALVSPYSWTYPGGVLRHIEALAAQFHRGGHEAVILAPYDPDDRLAARMHRGVAPQARELPDHVIPLGRTIGIPANGAMSNLSLSPDAVFRLRNELRSGRYDVAHVHEPVAPILGWDALCSHGTPLVGTFHCYSTHPLSNNLATLIGARRRLNRLHVRIAVSEAAAWTGRRFFGGRYRVIPNGVHVPDGEPAAPALNGSSPEQPLRIVFVGQPVERKGLPVLLRAFEALRDHVPVTLTLIGTSREEIAPLLLDDRGVTALGQVSDERKHEILRESDVLCAPSLGAESFGMVLTEAFAESTPVVASDIPGYADVVRDGIDGQLVPRGDARALAEALLELALDPERRAHMALAARERAERFAWPHVAEEVLSSYEDAISVPRATAPVQRSAVRAGILPSDLKPAVRARRLPSLEPPEGSSRLAAIVRRVAFAAVSIGGLALAALALTRIGIDRIAASLLASQPGWVVMGLAVMCLSMVLRGVSWYAILRASPVGRRARFPDALQGTFIGVLMSATLPARLGEPSRALIVARRVGRARETFPIVLGTLVSQLLINVVALAGLGTAMFLNVDVFSGHQGALLIATFAPVGVLAGVLVGPALIPSRARSRSARLGVLVVKLRSSAAPLRQGLNVFRNPRLALAAVAGQFGAWALQCTSCYMLLIALGLDNKAGFGAAAAVLFAVNVTAVVPATPSNLGVFQAACVAVLHGAFHVATADALAYGIILQAVEVATALVMGMPALVKEGLSWRDVRLRAMNASPVDLGAFAARARQRAHGAKAEL